MKRFANRAEHQAVVDREELMEVCFGTPRGDELPQAGMMADTMLQILSDHTDLPHEIIDAHYHQQIDPGVDMVISEKL